MKIEQDIALQIYSLMRLMRKNVTNTLTFAHELSMVQLQALQLISEGHETMRVLANEMHVKMPTLTTHIDKLEKAGYVKRSHDSNDRRVIRVTMTAKGKAAWKKSMDAKMERMQTMLQKMSLKDKKDLQRIITNISKGL